MGSAREARQAGMLDARAPTTSSSNPEAMKVTGSCAERPKIRFETSWVVPRATHTPSAMAVTTTISDSRRTSQSTLVRCEPSASGRRSRWFGGDIVGHHAIQAETCKCDSEQAEEGSEPRDRLLLGEGLVDLLIDGDHRRTESPRPVSVERNAGSRACGEPETRKKHVVEVRMQAALVPESAPIPTEAPMASPADMVSGLATEHVWPPKGHWIEWSSGAHFHGPASVTRTY